MKNIKNFKSFINESKLEEIGLTHWPKQSAIPWEDNIKNNTVEKYLDEGADPNFDFGMPLRLAIYYNNIEMVKILIDRGADPTSRRYLPIKVAAVGGYFEILNYLANLIKHKMSPELKERLIKDVEYWILNDCKKNGINKEEEISKFKKSIS